MKVLADRPQHMPRSGIREILELAAHMQNVIRLEVGEPNFPTPTHITEAAYKAATEGNTKYTLSAGIVPLRHALVEKMAGFNGQTVGIENVIVTPGSTAGLIYTFMALLNPGDEVLIPDPGWPTYATQVNLVGGNVVRYPLFIEDGFAPRAEHIEPLITAKTKAIILCNPSNPTGAVATPEAVAAIAHLAQKHDLYILSDEVYEHLIFEGKPTTTALYAPERTIGLYSFSKSYSMTGWRVGYIVADKPVAALISRICEPNTASVAHPNQFAALAALTGSQDCISQMRDAYKQRRDKVVALLKERGLYSYTPEGAFYLMVDVSAALPADIDENDATRVSYDFAKDFLKAKNVSVAPGATFGPRAAGFVRISLATAEDALLEGVARLCDYGAEQTDAEATVITAAV